MNNNRVLALHGADLGLIPSTPYEPPSSVRPSFLVNHDELALSSSRCVPKTNRTIPDKSISKI